MLQVGRVVLALGIQLIKVGRPDSWGSSLGGEILWCDLLYLYRKKQSKPQAAFLDPLAHPARTYYQRVP